MRQNIIVKDMSHLKALEVLGRHTALFVIMHHLVDVAAPLRGFQLVAQIGNLSILCR